MKVSGHPYPWCPATDIVFLDMDSLSSHWQCAQHRPIARALHPGRDSWRVATSSRGGFPSGPRVAVPSRTVCSASASRCCAGQLACTWPRPCAVVAPQPPRPRTLESRPTPLGLSAMRYPPPKRAPPQDHGYRRSSEQPALPRSAALAQASWPCTWPRPCGCSALAVSLSDSESCPTQLGPLATRYPPPERAPPQDHE
jgi:hypothetical protein